MNLGSQYTHAGRPKDAERVLLRGLHLADSLGLTSDRTYTLLALAQALEAEGNPAAALTWYKKHVQAMDSLNVQERDQRLAELTTRFETEKKEKELIASREQELISKQETEGQRSQKIFWLIGALFLGGLAIVLWNRVRTKRSHVAELELRNAEVLRQKERAEESDKAKDRFLANMSHELRTPLNAITGFTDLLLHDATDERHRRFLTTIRNAGDNLLVMINNVLDLGRIEAGRYSLRNEPFDLHRCVHLCVDMLHSRAMDQENELLLRIQEDVPKSVLGDSARLTQIILNLVGNALKFTSKGRVELDVAHVKEGVRFIVRDSGIGIPKDKLPNIFDRFSQVHDGDRRQY
ncbi:MAG TPA: histidine kinase dimerization/phospho-acceptor domain-containing protein, partial [Flavobacteriales bacterium]|nr:histidine kinase dimerization/phospho-acceptor domain-containing protein [Flavobacteriales bacterium]